MVKSSAQNQPASDAPAAEYSINPVLLPGGSPRLNRLPGPIGPGRLAVIFDLLVVIALSFIPCIYDIDGNSFGEGDQTTHAKVTQEMLHHGHWLFPTNKGRPYINKPPLKMWAAALPVKLLGESTFSYRILDGIIGILTIAAVYLFALLLFRSRLTGYIAALALLGCSGWFFGHGVRESVQDGAMIFFTVLALGCGYAFVRQALERPAEYRPDQDQRRLIRLAAGCGLFVGCGLMIKSAAALVAPLVLGVWLIVTGRLPQIVRSCWRELVLALTITISIPAMFFVPYFIARPRAMWMVFNTEVYKRAVKGYHNTNHPWFYFNVLFEDRSAVPPELLAAALLIAVYLAARRKDLRFSFLLCWSLVPILAYSAARSKLAWYINPAYPGMAILCGAVMAPAIIAAWDGIRLWNIISAAKKAATILTAVFSAAALILLVWHAQVVTARVIKPKLRNPVDRIVSQIQSNIAAGFPAGRVIAYQYGKLNNNERLYWEMVGIEYIEDRNQFEQALADPNLAFLVTRGSKFKELAPLRPFESYAFLPPKFVRRRWGAVISYRNEPNGTALKAAAWGINFADPRLAEGFGLENTSLDGNRAIRRSIGSRSGLVIDADLASATFGQNIELRAAPLKPVIVDVYANTFKIAELNLDAAIAAPGEYRTMEFHWAAERIEQGRNMISFQYRLPSGEAPAADEHLVAFESIQFELDQPVKPSLPAQILKQGEKKEAPAEDLDSAGPEQPETGTADLEAGTD